MSPDTSIAEHTARLAERAKEVALCLDFDGTLSPIVEDPQAARPLQGIVELLDPLAERFAAVALISGRPAAYLGEHAAARGVRYLGLYGLQEMQDGQVRVDARLEAARLTIVAAAEALRTAPAIRESGAWLEDKKYAVAIHTRRIADPDAWAAPIDQIARSISERYELEVIPGKPVWELRPPVRIDKGDAVRRVVTESDARTVVVVGDDLGDSARLRRRHPARGGRSRRAAGGCALGGGAAPATRAGRCHRRGPIGGPRLPAAAHWISVFEPPGQWRAGSSTPS